MSAVMEFSELHDAVDSDWSTFAFVEEVTSDQAWQRLIAQKSRSWAERNDRIDGEDLRDALDKACGFIADEVEYKVAIKAAKSVWSKAEERAKAQEQARARLAAKNTAKTKQLRDLVDNFNPDMWHCIIAHMVLLQGSWELRQSQARDMLRDEKDPMQIILAKTGNPHQSIEFNHCLHLEYLAEVIELYRPYFTQRTDLLGPNEGRGKEPVGKADMAIEAAAMLQVNSTDGHRRIRFWFGSFWVWTLGRYIETTTSEIRAMIVLHLNERYTNVGTAAVSNMLEQLKAQAILSSQLSLPCWLTKNQWPIEDMVATQDSIVHLPSYVATSDVDDSYSIDATPELFTASSFSYRFARYRRPQCVKWRQFLESLWPNDQQSIETLQEWFGYCLTPDTRQQKILFLIGPKRSGKGTMMRVLRAVVGEQNVCGPTLASIQTNFGLWPLLGKTVAIINDARLSSRSDQAVITERLLSISGEDAQTIDRKNLEPVTSKIFTRFVIVSNELPKLQDQSGALTGRMVVLRLTESFYGHEDQGLTDSLLDEREGILRWAIEGWRRLRERGYFVQPATSADVREQLDELSSPMSAFVYDMCDIGDLTVQVQTKHLYEAWCGWCIKHGNSAGSAQTFSRDLTALHSHIRCKQQRLGSDRCRVYQGIKLFVEPANTTED